LIFFKYDCIIIKNLRKNNKNSTKNEYTRFEINDLHLLVIFFIDLNGEGGILYCCMVKILVKMGYYLNA